MDVKCAFDDIEGSSSTITPREHNRPIWTRDVGGSNVWKTHLGGIDGKTVINVPGMMVSMKEQCEQIPMLLLARNMYGHLCRDKSGAPLGRVRFESTHAQKQYTIFNASVGRGGKATMKNVPGYESNACTLMRGIDKCVQATFR
jgi:hypothetical protein